MLNESNILKVDVNKLLKDLSLKKQYIKKLKNQTVLLNNVKQKNFKLLNLFPKNITQNQVNNDYVVMYIIDITFSNSNTFLSVMDASGKLKFFCSAGHLEYKGKNKKFRLTVLKSFYRILITKLRFLKGKPVALHLKNVGFNRFWIIKQLKSKLFVKVVKNFNIFPHNGCRKRKIRRKKF